MLKAKLKVIVSIMSNSFKYSLVMTYPDKNRTKTLPKTILKEDKKFILNKVKTTEIKKSIKTAIK